MPMNQHLIMFYVVFSVCRILFLVVRANCCVTSMLLLLLTVLAVLLSCTSGGKPFWLQ